MIDYKNVTFPNQATTHAEKVANDYDLMKRTIDSIINQANFNSSKYEEYERLVRVREGLLIEDDYNYILNPYNTNDSKYKKFPAKIRNYPLVGPVCDLLLGELSDRPRVEQVVATNSDATNALKEKINLTIELGLKQQFFNKLNDLGVDTGVESKNIDVKKLIEDIVDTFDDKLSIQGQDALDFLYYDLDLDDKYVKLFDDFLTYGEFYTYKDIRFDDVVHRNICPRDFWYSNSNVDYVEDTDKQVEKVKFTKTQIIEKFYNELTEKEIKDLDKLYSANDPFISTSLPFKGEITDENLSNRYLDEENANYIHGYHVAWKSLRREGELTYIDKETGQTASTTVNDTYKFDKLNGDLDIRWYWIPEFWEGYRLGLTGEELYKYFEIRQVPAQRGDINELSTTKGPYNGLIRSNRTKEITSICKTGYPYQVLFNTYHFQHEKIMNKNKDKITLFPLSLIPTNAGWTEDRFMYTATNLSFAFYNDKAPGAAAQLQGIKVLDMGLSDYAAKMYGIIQEIKAEFWDSVGMNRQRFGDIMASDGKGNTEQAIVRSAVVNQEMFRKFDKFKEKEANGLIDLSRIAWIEGKRGTFINSDNAVKTLEVVGSEHSLTEYGVFAKNSAKEFKKVNDYRAYIQPYLQNGGDMTTTAEILDTDNFSKMKSIMKRADKTKREYDKYVKEQELKIAQETNAVKTNEIKQKDETERYKADKQYDAAVDSALIRSGEEVDDSLEREKFSKDSEFKDRKLSLEEKKINNQDKQAKQKLNSK